MEMINDNFYNALKETYPESVTTFRECSLNQGKPFIEDLTECLNFDSIANKFHNAKFKSHNNNMPCSVDSFIQFPNYILLVEFKDQFNSRINWPAIKTKLSDTLLILSNETCITKQDFNKIRYFVVYKSKQPKPEYIIRQEEHLRNLANADIDYGTPISNCDIFKEILGVLSFKIEKNDFENILCTFR